MSQSAHVTFIHGLSNQPARQHLERIWLNALATEIDGDEGLRLSDLGVSTSFVYWSDLFYTEPLPVDEYESTSGDIEGVLRYEEPEPPDDPWIGRFREVFPDHFGDAEPVATDHGFERVPLPAAVKTRVMKSFAREAHAYLFNVDGIRDEIRGRVLDDLHGVPENTRHVMVGHSQGSFIAYDVLTATEAKEISGFLTLGSPLGVDEIQEKLVWTAENGFPTRVTGDWVNVYDRWDPISAPDPKLAKDFRLNGLERVVDVREQNWGRWRHSATKYFQRPKLRHHLRRLCDRLED